MQTITDFINDAADDYADDTQPKRMNQPIEDTRRWQIARRAWKTGANTMFLKYPQLTGIKHTGEELAKQKKGDKIIGFFIGISTALIIAGIIGYLTHH